MSIAAQEHQRWNCRFDADQGSVQACDDNFLFVIGKRKSDVLGASSQSLLDVFLPGIDPLELPYDEPIVLTRKKDRARFSAVLGSGSDGIRLFLQHAEDGYGRSVAFENERFYDINPEILAVGIPEERRLVRVNPALRRITGYAEEEVKAMDILDLVHTEDREVLQGYLRTVVEQGTLEGGRLRAVTKLGEEVWLDFNAFYDARSQVFYAIGRNVDEAVRAKQELQRNEEEYRLICEGLPEGIHTLSPHDPEGNDFKVEFVNNAFLESRGLNKDEVIGRNLLGFLQERDAEYLIGNVRKAYREECQVNYSGQVLYDNELRSYEARAIPVYDKKGSCSRIVVMSRDVTDEKRLKEELEQRKEEYRSIVEGVPVGMFMLSTSGKNAADFRYDFLNQRFLDERGMKRQDLLWKRLGDILEEMDAMHLLKYQRQAFEEKRTVEYQQTLSLEDGDRIFFERVVPIMDNNGDCLLLVGMSQDITKQKRMEERIRNSEKQFRQLVENINEGILRINANFEIEYINDSLLDRLGFGKEQLEGRNIMELAEEYDSGNIAKLQEVFNKRRAGKQWQNEFELLSSQGQRIPFIVSGTPLMDERGGFQGSIAIFTELTERKEIERKIHNAVMQTQESERKRFAEDLHEGIGQTLSGAKMQLYALENASKEELEVKVPELRSMIENAIDDTRTITNDLLPNELRDFGLVKAVENLLNRMEQYKIRVAFDGPEQDLDLKEALQVASYRIFQELLNNVNKHSSADELEVEMNIDDTNHFFFRITDNGRGFDMAQQENGIGILTVKRHAELFGGWVDIRSEPGEGTVAEGKIPVQ